MTAPEHFAAIGWQLINNLKPTDNPKPEENPMTHTTQPEAVAYRSRSGDIWEQPAVSGGAWASDDGRHYGTLSELTAAEGPLMLIAAFCERCDTPIYDGQPARAWALGLTNQFEHVTCPDQPANAEVTA